jgi:hypothetical protein
VQPPGDLAFVDGEVEIVERDGSDSEEQPQCRCMLTDVWEDAARARSKFRCQERQWRVGACNHVR